jgi:hypothetical protein
VNRTKIPGGAFELPVSNGQGGHNYFGGSGPDRNQWVSVKWLPPEWLGSRMDRS